MRQLMKPLAPEAFRIWWLDVTALSQMVGGRGLTIDLLDVVGLPPYISEEVRRLDRRVRGTVAVPPVIGEVRFQYGVSRGPAAKQIRGCRGVLVRATDTAPLSQLPGFVTTVDGQLVIPPPSERQGVFFRRMDAALRLGCVCGRKIDLVANPPHLVEGGIASDNDPKIRCEACASDYASA